MVVENRIGQVRWSRRQVNFTLRRQGAHHVYRIHDARSRRRHFITNVAIYKNQKRGSERNCAIVGTILKDSRKYHTLLRQFAKKCQRCDQQFALEEMVMRARNLAFHLDCFTCVTCNRRLGTGEQFVVNGNELYCQSVECFRV